MIDLEAIRARNQALKLRESADCRVHGSEHVGCSPDDPHCEGDVCRADQIADIDALLAEVDRLRADLQKYDSFAGGMIVEHRDAAGQAVGPTSTLREHLGISSAGEK